MIGRVSADSLRLAVAGLLLSMSSLQVFAESGGTASATSSGNADVSNPAQAFTRMFGGGSSYDSGGSSSTGHRHHRSHHRTTAPATTEANAAPSAAWIPQAEPAPAAATPPPAAETAHADNSAPIANTFSRPHTESRVSDWLPSSTSDAPDAEGISTAARIDLIAEKYGKQATVDFNSRIQEPDGVIAFRAIDNQTGERETIRIDRSGDIRLKSGWPE